jgi:hypothetical protein
MDVGAEFRGEKIISALVTVDFIIIQPGPA